MSEYETIVLRGTFYITFATLTTNGLIFLERIFLTRGLGAELFGTYALALSIINFTMYFIHLGIPTGILRFLPYYHSKSMAEYENGLKRFGYLYGTITGVIFSIIILSTSPLIGKFYNSTTLAFSTIIFSPVIFFLLFADIVSTVFLAYSDTGFKVLWRSLIFMLIRSLGCILLFIFKAEIYSYVFLYLLSSFVIFIAGVYKKPKSYKPYKYELKKVLNFSIPVALVGFYGLLMGRIDSMMIGKMVGIKFVGFYSLGFNLALLVKMFFNSSSEPFLPMATRLAGKNDISGIKKLLIFIDRWNIYITFIILTSGLLIGPILIPILFGEEFVHTIKPFTILSLGFFIQSIFGLFAVALTAFGITRPFLYMSIFTGLLNIILNFSLIPKTGIIGAAIATITSELTFDIMGTIFLFIKYKILPFDRKLLLEISFLLFLSLLMFLTVNIYLKSIVFITSFLIFVFFFKNNIKDYIKTRGEYKKEEIDNRI